MDPADWRGAGHCRRRTLNATARAPRRRLRASARNWSAVAPTTGSEAAARKLSRHRSITRMNSAGSIGVSGRHVGYERYRAGTGLSQCRSGILVRIPMMLCAASTYGYSWQAVVPMVANCSTKRVAFPISFDGECSNSRKASDQAWPWGQSGAHNKKPRVVRGSERLTTHLSALAGLVLAGQGGIE